MTDRERLDDRTLGRRVLVIAGVLLAVLAVSWLVVTLRSLLFMVVVSVFVAITLMPPVHFLVNRGWRRGAATGVVFLGAFLGLVLFLWALAPVVINQVGSLIEALPDLVVAGTAFLEDTFGFDLSEFDPSSAGRDLADSIAPVGQVVVGGLVGLGATIAGFLIFVTTVALFSFYMVADFPRLQSTVLTFLPAEGQRRAMHIWDVAVEKMGGYVYSRLVLAVISGGLSALFLWALDVPFALSLGVWVGVISQAIPVVGTYLAGFLPAVVALSSQGARTMLWVILIFVGYQQVENYLIAPPLTRRTMAIHPAVSVAAILAGGALMGGIGVVLALPVTGIVQALVSEMRRRHDLILDDVPVDSGAE